jgi:hypothetical protein
MRRRRNAKGTKGTIVHNCVRERSPRGHAGLGAAAIAAILGMPVRRAFDFLEKGRIPARQQGRMWQTTREELYDYLRGLNCPAPAPEAARGKAEAPIRRKSVVKRNLPRGERPRARADGR